MDYSGLALIVGGVGLSVFGLQQSSLWGWGDPAIEICIAAGVVLLGAFVAVERIGAPAEASYFGHLPHLLCDVGPSVTAGRVTRRVSCSADPEG